MERTSTERFNSQPCESLGVALRQRLKHSQQEQHKNEQYSRQQAKALKQQRQQTYVTPTPLHASVSQPTTYLAPLFRKFFRLPIRLPLCQGLLVYGSPLEGRWRLYSVGKENNVARSDEQIRVSSKETVVQDTMYPCGTCCKLCCHTFS